MAIGDAALAAGMPLVNGAAANSAPQIDDYINETRDFIAQRTSEITPIAKGGTGADSAAGARSALGIVASNIPTGSGTVQSDLEYLSTSKAAASTVNALSAAVAGKAAIADVSWVQDGNMTTNIYNRGTAGAWRTLAIQADGRLAHTASARRFKENITPLDVTDEQVQAFELVEFDMVETGYHDIGLIADDLEAAGLEQFVFHDHDGQVLGIHYERVALTLLPVVQRLITRVEALEARDA